MEDFSELLKKRRAIRDYEERDVPLDMVKEIIRGSCLAPSSGNRQPWKFIIINNKAVIKRLSDENKKNLIADLERNPASPSKQYEAALRNPDFNVFYNAPCLVYIVGQKEVRSLQVDCALAACYFMLLATERGLGTCWIGLGTYILDPELLDLMGMPKDGRIVAPIIVGYPRAIPAVPERLDPAIVKIVS